MNMTNDYRLIFITGASGSGTTLLTKILSSPRCVLSVGGKHRTVGNVNDDAAYLSRRFNKITKALWDRKGSREQHAEAQDKMPYMVGRFRQFDEYTGLTHLLMKRSAPFYEGDQYRPDLDDLIDAFPDLKIVVAYRDPRASTFSSYRRDFVDNLRYAAVVCEEQLTYLAAQLSTLPPEMYRVVGYELFCATPEAHTRQLADFLGLPPDEMLRAVDTEKIDPTRNDLWQQELTEDEIDFVNKFFNARRLAQWRLLQEAANALNNATITTGGQ